MMIENIWNFYSFCNYVFIIQIDFANIAKSLICTRSQFIYKLPGFLRIISYSINIRYEIATLWLFNEIVNGFIPNFFLLIPNIHDRSLSSREIWWIKRRRNVVQYVAAYDKV